MTQDKGIARKIANKQWLTTHEKKELEGDITTALTSLQEELTSTKDLLDIAKGEARLHAERSALLQEERDEAVRLLGEARELMDMHVPSEHGGDHAMAEVDDFLRDRASLNEKEPE